MKKVFNNKLNITFVTNEVINKSLEELLYKRIAFKIFNSLEFQHSLLKDRKEMYIETEKYAR